MAMASKLRPPLGESLHAPMCIPKLDGLSVVLPHQGDAAASMLNSQRIPHHGDWLHGDLTINALWLNCHDGPRCIATAVLVHRSILLPNLLARIQNDIEELGLGHKA